MSSKNIEGEDASPQAPFARQHRVHQHGVMDDPQQGPKEGVMDDPQRGPKEGVMDDPEQGPEEEVMDDPQAAR